MAKRAPGGSRRAGQPQAARSQCVPAGKAWDAATPAQSGLTARRRVRQEGASPA